MRALPSPTALPLRHAALHPRRSARAARRARVAAFACVASAEASLALPYGDARGAALLLEDVALSVGPADLLSGANLRVEPGECIGLVGSNGCGKSTLLRCVAGRRAVDGGRVSIAHGAAVGYLEQTAVSGSSRTVAEEARSRMAATAAAARLAAAEAAASVAQAPASAVLELAAARDAYEAAGGAGAERSLAAVLDGLGFSKAQREQRCDALSGGWQMRVALARLLLSPAGEGRGPSLLLLGASGARAVARHALRRLTVTCADALARR
jgi:ATPase subunit of ABC transporter with duplicated ATPase domains